MEIFGCQLRETFSTSGSRSFDLIATGKNLGKGAIVGWIDVHYPCRGHVRLKVRASVPERVLSGPDALKALSRLALELVEADPKEQFEVYMFSASNCASMSSSGTGAIETSRLFTPPSGSANESK